MELRFNNGNLTITLKRGINDNIKCYGNVLDVLNRFLLFGFSKLYAILYDFNIDTTNFKESLRLESYSHYHLAKDIGFSIEIKQPELSNRLKLNQMNNNKESLARNGLKYHVHYIDFSRYDEYGYRIPEYEIEYRNRDGMSRAELERDLLVLESEFRPKEQTTIDNYLYTNEKFYTLIKGFVPIPEFSIESNRDIVTIVPELYKRESILHGLPILDKLFSNRTTIRTKFMSTDT